MKRKALAMGAIGASMLASLFIPQGAVAADPGTTHVFWLQGVSSIQSQRAYVHAPSNEADELGIFKPSTLPPTPTLPGNQGCTEVGNPLGECSFSGGRTWYYGFCGQTYGGAYDITFTFSGQTWHIDRMGFPRGRGAWEFNGKMTRVDGPGTAFIRLYLASVPNNPDEVAACDLTHNITSIYFQGMAMVTRTQQPRALAGKPGWHWCDGTTVEAC